MYDGNRTLVVTFLDAIDYNTPKTPINRPIQSPYRDARRGHRHSRAWAFPEDHAPNRDASSAATVGSSFTNKGSGCAKGRPAARVSNAHFPVAGLPS